MPLSLFHPVSGKGTSFRGDGGYGTVSMSGTDEMREEHLELEPSQSNRHPTPLDTGLRRYDGCAMGSERGSDERRECHEGWNVG